jgi:hypothetical protein
MEHRNQHPDWDKMNTPFDRELLDAGFDAENTDIRTWTENPEEVIRIRANGIVSSAEIAKEYKRGDELINELSNEFGVAAAPREHVIGHDPDTREPATYTISARIHGQDLGEIAPAEKADDPRIKELDDFYKSLAQYYEKKYRESGDYLSDLSSAQFVWGRKNGDNRDKVYLVDTDPIFLHFDKSRSGNKEIYAELSEDFFGSVRTLGEMIVDSEHDLNHNRRWSRLKLKSARAELKKFWQSMDDEDRKHYHMVELARRLNF